MKATEKPILNKHKTFNENGLDCILAIRACSHLMPPVSPEAYNLSRYLATWWNNRNANGIVNPSQRRIYLALGMNDAAIHAAANELESVGWWKPKFNGSDITSYVPLFLERIDARTHAFLKRMRSSLNHSKADSRYYRIKNPLAKALTAFAVERIQPKYNDLGYYFYLRSNQKNRIHYIKNHGTKAKMVHSVMFQHPITVSEDPMVWAALARTKRLPLPWTEKSFAATFTMEEFQQRVKADDHRAVDEAIEEVRESGYWGVDVEYNPFGNVLTMKPLYPLHQLVWEIDLANGGQALSDWEARRGFGELNDFKESELPPLGYHYIYALRSVMTGKVLIVGQTTQSLVNRLHQHMRSASNPDANKAIKWVVMSGSDSLEIVHLATVFHTDVARVEMDAANWFLSIGHPVQNKILDEQSNRSTIKPDSRFGGLTKEENWERLDDELERCLARHRGESVLWRAPNLAEDFVLEASAAA